jgi:hypothetical protein
MILVVLEIVFQDAMQPDFMKDEADDDGHGRSKKTKRSSKAMVGTTKKSTETMSLAWFLRKVRKVWEGGFGCRTMYLATVACDTSIPIFSNSP